MRTADLLTIFPAMAYSVVTPRATEHKTSAHVITLRTYAHASKHAHHYESVLFIIIITDRKL